ncbi:MAG TPA: hypothetical protein VGO53_11485, partial [Steroidobacteraceae bacterium]|nr:hypothetical protein [Steroidobacteraceae bacterium]
MFVSKSGRGCARLQQFVFVVALITALLGARQANAFDPEWQWMVVGHSPPTFTTQGQAANYMRSLTSIDPRYALLSVARRVEGLRDTSETYRYEAPKQAPIPT